MKEKPSCMRERPADISGVSNNALSVSPYISQEITCNWKSIQSRMCLTFVSSWPLFVF